MENPFELILAELTEIRTLLEELKPPEKEPEIIDRKELMKRFNLTEPTVIAWEKKGKIPSLRIGSAVRYNWPKVIAALEKNSYSNIRRRQE